MTAPAVPGIRAFRPADVEPIVALWNESAPADPTTVPWFTRSVLLDPDFDAGGLLVAERDGELVGCCYAARRRPGGAERAGGADGAGKAEAGVGWIVFAFTRPDCRRQGIAAALAARALGLLAGHGCSTVRLATMTPHYVVPGLDEAAYPAGRGLLRRSGFQAVEEVVAMSASLLGLAESGWSLPEPGAARLPRSPAPGGLDGRRASLTAAGYRFGPPADGELPQLIEFAATFSADWAEALRELLIQPHEVRPVLTVHRDGQVLGFAAYGAYRGVRERFGPFGVDPAARGLGLGRLLLAQTLTAMRADGLQNAWFLWTEEASAAAHLYRQAGFAVSRRFSLWERPL